MPQRVRTTATDPIRIDRLPVPWAGEVGLTFAPGKKQRDAASGSWDRELQADLDRIRTGFRADHLVCLLEDDELVELAIPALPERAALAGLSFHRLPISDGAVPRDLNQVQELVSRIASWAAAGENVVIHCKGGLGRAGTIGGCLLRAAGMDGERTLAALAVARDANCPETPAQREYVLRYVAGPPVRRSRVLGAVIGAEPPHEQFLFAVAP